MFWDLFKLNLKHDLTLHGLWDRFSRLQHSQPGHDFPSHDPDIGIANMPRPNISILVVCILLRGPSLPFLTLLSCVLCDLVHIVYGCLWLSSFVFGVNLLIWTSGHRLSRLTSLLDLLHNLKKKTVFRSSLAFNSASHLRSVAPREYTVSGHIIIRTFNFSICIVVWVHMRHCSVTIVLHRCHNVRKLFCIKITN